MLVVLTSIFTMIICIQMARIYKAINIIKQIELDREMNENTPKYIERAENVESIEKPKWQGVKK